jgi:hypothetical protein
VNPKYAAAPASNAGMITSCFFTLLIMVNNPLLLVV